MVTGASGAKGGPAQRASASADQSKLVPKELRELTLKEYVIPIVNPERVYCLSVRPDAIVVNTPRP